LPPLSGLIDVLSLSLESEGLFSIHNATDYEDVGNYVDILSVALSDIESYVAQEREIRQTGVAASQDASGSSPRKGEKEKPLILIQRYLDRIYSKIGGSDSFYNLVPSSILAATLQLTRERRTLTDQERKQLYSGCR